MLGKIFNSKTRMIFQLLRKGGARDILVVGGCVRDYLLQQGIGQTNHVEQEKGNGEETCVPNLLGESGEIRDLDIEVYGLSYRQIADILRTRFHVDLVGQSFGVLKVGRTKFPKEGASADLEAARAAEAFDRIGIDVSLPRQESKLGVGHKGFDVVSDPGLSYEEAFARRDFTINAIGLKEDGTFVDPFGGREDLKNGILRATSPAFKEDPLRVLRGAQFLSRFGFRSEPTTVGYCREVLPEFPALSGERIYEEWYKWAVRGNYPSLGLEFLKETGWAGAFPELSAIIGCPQNPEWHPEGDVWTHTLLVCNEAKKAIFRAQEEGNSFSEEEQAVLMFAALGHDFGKPGVTKRDPQGIIRSRGHAAAGVPLMESFLTRIKAPKRIVEMVKSLVGEHMIITNPQLHPPTAKIVRRLAARLDPRTFGSGLRSAKATRLGASRLRQKRKPSGSRRTSGSRKPGRPRSRTASPSHSSRGGT